MAVRHYSSPGVFRREIDASNIVAPAGTSTGAIVVRSTQGPINLPVLVTSDKDLLDTFGKPVFTSGAGTGAIYSQVPDAGYGLYAALQFLQESNTLYVSRIASSGDDYAGVGIASTYYDYTKLNDFSTSASTSAVSGYGCAATMIGEGDQFDTPTNISSIENSNTIFSVSGFNSSSATANFFVGALAPGNAGNNIAISLETFSVSATSAGTIGCDWLFKYDGIPVSGGISAATSATQVIESKIIRVDVYTIDKSQTWNSVIGSLSNSQATSYIGKDLRTFFAPVETFYGTIGNILSNDGKQLNLAQAVNGVSNFIYIKTGSGAAFSPEPIKNFTSGANILSASNILPLGGGKDEAVTSATCGLGTDASSAWNLFESREFLPGINILINPDWDATIKQKVARIAATRMDCIAVGQSGDPTKVKVTDILNSEIYGYVNPSYMALYAGYDKIYDQYNDKFFYLPKAAFGAAIMARVDRVSNTWDAPAGTTRGIIPSFSQKFTLTDALLGQLYDKNINTSKSIIGTGSVMWGQKTAQLKASALDRINVRRLLIYVENSIEPLLQSFLFELNTDRTRSRVTSLVGSFLNGVQGAGGLTGFSVVCDSSNNTADVIDNNQLFCDIYVQPTRVIEFITLRTIITRTGVSTVEI